MSLHGGEKYEVVNKDDVDMEVNDSGFSEMFYVAACNNAVIRLNSKCIKVVIENCKDTTIIVHGRILTNTLEIFKTDNCRIAIKNNCVQTMQADKCTSLSLDFSSIDHFPDTFVWAGVDTLVVTFADAPMHNFTSGFKHMQAKFSGLDENISQFVVAFKNGQIVTEQKTELGKHK